jgi:tetratricopeptide (TPR) repeat protein
LFEDFPDVPDYRYELCETLATTRFRGSRFLAEEHPTAEQRLRKALELSKELVREHPNIPEYTGSQIHIHHKLAHVLRHTGRPKESEASLRSALDLQSALVRQFPAVSSHRAWQAVVQESLADLLRERGELNEARSLLEDSVSMLNDCLAEDRKPEHVRLLVRNYENLADVLSRLGEQELADAARRQARGHRTNSAFDEGLPTSPRPSKARPPGS